MFDSFDEYDDYLEDNIRLDTLKNIVDKETKLQTYWPMTYWFLNVREEDLFYPDKTAFYNDIIIDYCKTLPLIKVFDYLKRWDKFSPGKFF